MIIQKNDRTETKKENITTTNQKKHPKKYASERILNKYRRIIIKTINPKKRKLSVSWQTDTNKYTCTSKRNSRNIRRKIISNKIIICKEK